MERMQGDAWRMGGTAGLVGVNVEEGSHGWDSHVIEFSAMGTAILPIGDPTHEVHESPDVVLVAQDWEPRLLERRRSSRSRSAERVSAPLRLVVYDRTDTAPLAVPRIERDADGAARGTGGLSRWWRLGAAGHRMAGRASASLGAGSWSEALRWAAAQADARGAPIGELQAWGPRLGLDGGDRQSADRTVASPGGALGDEVDALARVLAPGALVWLRSACSAFGHHGRTSLRG